MEKVFVRAPSAYDADEVSDFSAVEFEPDSSLTHQSFKEECDINTICTLCLFSTSSRIENRERYCGAIKFTWMEQKEAINLASNSV